MNKSITQNDDAYLYSEMGEKGAGEKTEKYAQMRRDKYLCRLEK